jgi:ABC-2 type transport system permease protein
LKDDEDVQKLSGRINQYLANAASGKGAVVTNTSQGVDTKTQQSKMALGIFTMFILMFMGTVSILLLEDKNKKTFMRNFCAPIKEREMMFGYLIANTFLGCIQIIIFLSVSTLMLNIKLWTSTLNVFVVLLFFLIASIGFSIGMAGFVNDQQKYNMVMMLFSVTTSFLGGLLPLDFMDNIFQRISKLIPQKWVMDSYMQLASGKSLFDIRFNLLILLLFGLVFFTFGVKALKPTVEDM